MMRDKDGKSKGCAFVRFAQRGGADAACATLNGTLSLPGAARPMVVKYANPSEPRGKSNPNYGYPQQVPPASPPVRPPPPPPPLPPPPRPPRLTRLPLPAPLQGGMMAMMAPDGSTSYAQGMGGMMGASPGSPLMMPGSPPMAMMGQMNPAMMMGLMPGQPHGMGHQMMMGHQLMGGGGFQDQLGVVQMQMPPMSQIHSQLQSHAAAYGMQAAAQPPQYGAQPPQYGSQPPSADPSASYGAGPSGWGEAEAAPRMSDPPQSSPYAPWGGGGGGGGPSSLNGGGQYATAGIERGMAGASLDGGGGGAGTWTGCT